MKMVIQRVTKAQVEVEGRVVGAISAGVVVLLGVTHSDTEEKAAWLARKLVDLRLFEDDQGKTNRSLLEKKGEALIVSQFTLYADCTGGRRPSFTQAAPPELATRLYLKFIEEVKKGGVPVQSGIFGAYMQVSLVNDGPVTLILDN